MKFLNIALVLLLSTVFINCNPASNTTLSENKDFSIGEVVEFHSDVLNEDRTINILST